MLEVGKEVLSRKTSAVSSKSLVEIEVREHLETTAATALPFETHPRNVSGLFVERIPSKVNVVSRKSERSRFYQRTSSGRKPTGLAPHTGIVNRGYKERIARMDSNKTNDSDVSEDDGASVFLTNMSGFSEVMEEKDWPKKQRNTLPQHSADTAAASLEMFSRMGIDEKGWKIKNAKKPKKSSDKAPQDSRRQQISKKPTKGLPRNPTEDIASLEIISKRGFVSRPAASRDFIIKARTEELSMNARGSAARCRSVPASCKILPTQPTKRSVFRCYSEGVQPKDVPSIASVENRGFYAKQSIFTAGQITSTVGSFLGSKLIKAVNVGLSSHVDISIFSSCDYPFENLVFEGGGNKGTAYVGALQVCHYCSFLYHFTGLFISRTLTPTTCVR